MKDLRFVKMHGTGNDYVLVDGRRKAPARPGRLARLLCDRRTGVGADGLLLALPSRKADVRMRMFNPDGSEGKMCGNGLRCLAKYVAERPALSPSKGSRRRPGVLEVETASGTRSLKLSSRNGRVYRIRVDMGEPIFLRRLIPMRGGENALVLEEPVRAAGRRLKMTCLSLGNPHAVIFVKGLDRFPVEEVGRKLQNLRAFPEGVNVSFAEPLGATRLRQRTYERGAGETWACGSGACAVCVSGVLTGRSARRVRIQLRGGELELRWAPDNHVALTGPAVEVFEGVWPGR